MIESTRGEYMATPQYDRENTRRINLKLNNKTDKDIIDWLNAKKDTEGIQGYLKRLIREDMKGAGTMKYAVKEEYTDLWGEEVRTLTEDEIEMIARGWEKTVEEVIDQLEPVNYESAVALMDDDIREEVHADLAPCSDAAFLWEYCKRHQAKYGRPFEI